MVPVFRMDWLATYQLCHKPVRLTCLSFVFNLVVCIVQGDRGTPGRPGAGGAPGAGGEPGAMGPKGDNGDDGRPVSSVTLYSNATT